MHDLIISAREISNLLQYDKRAVLDEVISNARKTSLRLRCTNQQ